MPVTGAAAKYIKDILRFERDSESQGPRLVKESLLLDEDHPILGPVHPVNVDIEVPRESAARAMAAQAVKYPEALFLGAGFPARQFTMPPSEAKLKAYLAHLSQKEKKSEVDLLLAAGAYTPTVGQVRPRRLTTQVLNADLGLDLHFNNAVPSSGNSQALYAVTEYFNSIYPKLAVFVDEQTYTGALSIFRGKAEVYPVKMDEDGPVPDSLEEAYKQAKKDGFNPGFYYTMPDGHNPTGRTFGLDRRKEIVNKLGELGLFCFEDNAYSFLKFAGIEQLPPLAALDPFGLVIYAVTFSKVFVPAMRCALLHTPSNLIGLNKVVVNLSDAFAKEIGKESLFPNGIAWLNFEAFLHDDNMQVKSLKELAAPRADFYSSCWEILQKGLDHYLGDIFAESKDATKKDLSVWYRRQVSHGFFTEIEYRSPLTAMEISDRLLKEEGVITMPQDDFIPERAKAQMGKRAGQMGRLCFSYAKATHPREVIKETKSAVERFGNGFRKIHNLSPKTAPRWETLLRHGISRF